MQTKDIPKIKLEFISGLISGFISVSFCAPLDVARTRINAMVNMNITIFLIVFLFILKQMTTIGKNKYNGFLNTLKKIYKEEGFQGLYKGILLIFN